MKYFFQIATSSLNKKIVNSIKKQFQLNIINN